MVSDRARRTHPRGANRQNRERTWRPLSLTAVAPPGNSHDRFAHQISASACGSASARSRHHIRPVNSAARPCQPHRRARRLESGSPRSRIARNDAARTSPVRPCHQAGAGGAKPSRRRARNQCVWALVVPRTASVGRSNARSGLLPGSHRTILQILPRAEVKIASCPRRRWVRRSATVHQLNHLRRQRSERQGQICGSSPCPGQPAGSRSARRSPAPIDLHHGGPGTPSIDREVLGGRSRHPSGQRCSRPGAIAPVIVPPAHEPGREYICGRRITGGSVGGPISCQRSGAAMPMLAKTTRPHCCIAGVQPMRRLQAPQVTSDRSGDGAEEHAAIAVDPARKVTGDCYRRLLPEP